VSFELGDTIADRYRVEAQLARGKSGEVYRVMDAETKAPLALRVEYPASKDFPEARVRASRAVEVSAYFGSRHDGFVRAWSTGVLPDRGVWLSMDLIDDARPLDLRDGEQSYRLTLILRAARRVAELHDLGVVHRSLRPDAFLLDAEDRVLLTEFGLARQQGDPLESGEGSLDAWEAILSHPAYLAPEQVRATYVDHRADLYALGVLLYEALVGHVPFRGSLSEILDQHSRVRAGEQPRPRPSLATHVPLELDQLCAEALQLEPDQRLSEASAFCERLEAACSSSGSRRSGRLPLLKAPPAPPRGVRQLSEETGTYLNEKDSSILLWIPGAALDGPDGPTHVAGFYAGKYPVTWGQFRHFCEVTQRELEPARFPVDENHPVHNVSYQDALDYCAWAGLRLLREAEWRYAAQATENTAYPWGDDPPSPTRCNWAGHPRHGRRRTAPVGSFPAGASPYGVLDLAGNIAEWVMARGGTPEAPVLGGSFRSEPAACSVGFGELLPQDAREGHVGFRVALSPRRATGRSPAPPRPTGRRGRPGPRRPGTARPPAPARPPAAARPPQRERPARGPLRRLPPQRVAKRPPPTRRLSPLRSGPLRRPPPTDRAPRPQAKRQRPLTDAMRHLLQHVEILLEPIAEGLARKGAELKFTYGQPPVGYSFLITDPEARYAFLEQRVVIDPEHLYGQPTGRVNLLMASNAITYFSRGLRCVVTRDRLRFRRELYLHEGQEPILRAELKANLDRLCQGWAEIFQPLRHVQEGVPWHSALAFLREKRPPPGGRGLQALEEMLSDLGPQREGNQLAVFVEGSGDHPVLLSVREDLQATLLIREWHPPAYEAEAVKAGEHAPQIEALLEELNKKNAKRPYALGWDPKRGVVASVQVTGTGGGPPARERVLDCLVTLGHARAAETFRSLGE